ncbi:MAG: hypothetical protein M0036_22935 [Desulfobacteraceae bacterium]|nr:hypothetical protein [Desulfobacteraceae bacterium]
MQQLKGLLNLRRTNLALIVIFFFCNGCASLWQPVHGTLSAAHWSVQVPDGWMRLTTPTYEMLSKDGPYLQYILIQERPISEGFHATGQKMDTQMLPNELAQVVIDTIQVDRQIRDLYVLSAVPAMIGGRQGFKLIYTYLDQNSVEMKTIHYGALFPPYYFNLRYTAAARHYFDADENTFEQVAGSMRFIDGKQ